MVDNNVKIRAAVPADAAQIAEIYAPIVSSTFISFEESPPSAEEMRARIESGSATHPWLVACDESTIAGYAYASQHRTRAAYRWSVDVSAYVRETYRGRGVGRQLYGVLFPLLGALGFHRAFAGIALPNDASIALHRSCGFEPVGIYREVGFKLGAWRDTSWWQLALGTSDAPPSEPLRP
jgi:phosphinothricin acetyltransferase